MKPIKLRLFIVQRLSLLTIALTFGASSSFIIGTAKAAEILFGNNCKIQVPKGVAPDLLDTLFDMVEGKDVSEKKCNNFANQIAANVGGSASSTTTTNQPTTSGGTTAAAPATDPKADSDGDGIPDAEDKRRALIADVPALSYGIIGQTAVGINLAEKGSTTERKQSIRLERETGQSSEKTNSSTYTNEISASVTASIKPFSTDSGVDVSVGYSHTWENSYSNTSIQQSRNLAEDLQEKTETQGATFRGGGIDITVKITNEGTAPISISDFSVAARKRTGSSANNFQPVATLTPKVTGNEFKRDLAPDQSIEVPVGASIDDLSALEDFLKNPESLYFEVIRPQLNWPATGGEARFQKSFSLIETEIKRKTVGITIDYGRGKVENYHVASGEGITFAQLMKILNLQYKTQGDQVTAICKSAGSDCPPEEWIAADASQGLVWGGRIASAKNRNPRLTIAPGGKFDDTIFSAGDAIFFAFVEDRDKDGLPRSEEVRYKTVDDPTQCKADAGCQKLEDFDGDGISDYDEVRVGWKLGTKAKTHVFSAPSKADADGDGWNDAQEQKAQTDPNLDDTDGDTLADAKDPNPTEPDQAVAAAPVTPTKTEVMYFETRNTLLDYMTAQKFRQFGSTYLKGTAVMSSSLNPKEQYGPHMGIDGNVDAARNFFHTQNSANEWWKLKLSKPQEIRYIVIWNRVDKEEIQAWAKDFELVLRDSNGKPVASVGAIPLWDTDASIVREKGIMVVALPAKVEATEIEIKKKAGTTSHLNLSEVEVYGVPSTAAIPTAQIAEGFWKGSFTCFSLSTPFEIRLKKVDDLRMDGSLSFYDKNGKPGVWNLAGEYHAGTSRLILRQTGWVSKPQGNWLIFDLDGTLVGDDYSGKTSEKICHQFSLKRTVN